MRLAFSSLACPGWPVEDVVGAAKRHGYEGVEWRLADGSLLGRRTDAEVWRRIADADVEAVCLDTSAAFVQATDDARASAIDIAAVMSRRAVDIGAPFIRVFAGTVPEDADRDDLVASARDALAAAAEKLAGGVRMLIETHDSWSRGSDITELVDGLDDIGVVWDIAHSVRTGESPAATIEAIGVPDLVHVKDADGDLLTHLGAGTIPIAECVEILRTTGYDEWLSFEWEKLWHPDLDDAEFALPRAAAYLRDLL